MILARDILVQNYLVNNIFLETIKIVDGEIFNIDYHQKRYESVLEEFGVKNFKDLKSLINPPEYGLYRCRLTYDLSISPHKIEVEFLEYKKRNIKTLKVIFDNDIDYKYKSTCRDNLDKLYNLRDECDDIIIIKNLLVTDTSIANIAFYTDSGWITPKTPLLKGTTRQRLIDEDKLIEVDIKVQDIKKFSKIALLNSMIGFDVLESCEFLI